MNAKMKKNFIGILIAAGVIMIVVAVGVLVGKNEQNAGTTDASNSMPWPVESMTTEEIDAQMTRFVEAKEANEDTVGWLTVPGTDIDAAVLQSEDNEYYLTRNEAGEEDEWGCYFADYFSTLEDPAAFNENTVIYGHTGTDENPNGQRFAQLYRYLDINFLKAHPTLYLTSTDETVSQFEIFAVYYSDIDFYYIDPSPSNQGFETFMEGVNARNEYIFEGMEVTPEDSILTLSGCSTQFDTNNTGNHRFVVMAKLIEEEPQTQEIRENPEPLRPVA